MFLPGRLHSIIPFSLALFAGCSSGGGQLGTLQTQNRSLLEQNKVQLAEIENLNTHARRLEDKLIDAERQLAALENDPSDGTVVKSDGRPASVFDRSMDPANRAASEPDSSAHTDGGQRR